MAGNTTKKSRVRRWRRWLGAIGGPARPRPTCSTPNLLFPVWQKSLEIAQNRLREKKLPPLELHTHSSQSTNEIVQATIRDLQQVIDTNQNGHGAVARTVQVIFNKYIGIVDVAIQHSPEITFLVWSGIRGILQVCFQCTMISVNY